jgi:3-dehydroquinate dehydratase/shikimate dehydrogenase
MICVSIGRTRHKMVVLEHRALAARGAQFVELRLDWLQNTPDLGFLLNERPTPVILTCRRPQDQGRWRGPEDQRLTLLRAAIAGGAEYIDLEHDIANQVRRYGNTKRVISYHNFEETPDDLEEIHERL